MNKIACWNDSHCHLDLEPLCHNLKHFIYNARSVGVWRILVPGVIGSVRLIAAPPGVFFAWGVHPAFASTLTASRAGLNSLFQSCTYRPVAIGECGLDKKCKVPLDLQIACFRYQAALAQREGLPLIVHARGYWQLVQTVLMEEAPGVPWIFHAYCGSPELARQLSVRKGVISISPPVTKASAHKYHEVVKVVPIDRFMLETDGPDMTPDGWHADFGDSSAIPIVGEKVADLRNVLVEQIAALQNANFEGIFGNLETISGDVLL